MKPKIKPKYNIINKIEEIKEKNINFENVIKVNSNEYVVVLNAYELAKLYDDEDLVYLSSTQRGTRIIKDQEVPISSKQNIKEMASLIRDNNLCMSYITLGCPVGSLEYTKDDLHVNSQLFILDGYNRLSSCGMIYMYYKVLNEDYLLDCLVNTKFTVLIGEYSEDKAKSIFSQLSKGLKLSKSRTESFDTTKASNRIVNKLNKNSIIKGMIDDTKTTINKTDKIHLYTFSSVNEAIKQSFGTIQSVEEENNIYDFLELFFEELVKIFPEMLSYETRSVSKEYSLICTNFMIYGLMGIAEDLYLKRFNNSWKDEMSKLGKINFDIDSDIWKGIVREHGDKITVVNNKQTRGLMSRLIREQFYKI